MSIKFIFFGGEPLAVPVLNQLKAADLMPEIIVCNPDRPVGRDQIITKPPAKVWAETEGIEVFQPTNYKDESISDYFKQKDWEVFVVVAYNFILPKWLLDIPKHGVINVHPSLLPRLRGASPIRTALLKNLPDEVGVTIMLLDEAMDHGPMLDQEQLTLTKETWPMSGPLLDKKIANLGGKLLAQTLPEWIKGEISPQEQDHEQATYCGKLQKSESELKINPFKLPGGIEALKAWHAINAFAGIGDTYFIHNNKRVKITAAELATSGSLNITKVVPEGKKEINFTDYLRSITE